MNKKAPFSVIVLIGCAILLIGSYMHWKGNISSVGGNSTKQTSSPEKNDDKKSDDVVKPELDVKRLLALRSNADEQVQNVFSNRHESDEKVNFLITGSTILDSGKPGYAERLNNALKEAYGDAISVQIEGFDGTSEEFLDEKIDLSPGYDIVLLEPLTLKNNGLITIEEEQQHIKTFQERLTDETEDTVVILHPPNPIHAATYYLQQVSALKSFAESEGIPYIDHWPQWPDPATDKISSLLDDSGAPNKDGAEIWANALIEYFIAP